jgi:hypothetical protein
MPNFSPHLRRTSAGQRLEDHANNIANFSVLAYSLCDGLCGAGPIRDAWARQWLDRIRRAHVTHLAHYGPASRIRAHRAPSQGHLLDCSDASSGRGERLDEGGRAVTAAVDRGRDRPALQPRGVRVQKEWQHRAGIGEVRVKPGGLGRAG